MFIKSITLLAKQKVKIELSDGTTFKVREETYTEFFLYVGKELTAPDIESILSVEAGAKDYYYAVNLLSKKDYSTKEIKDKLIKRKVSEGVIHQIITKLTRFNFLDDKRYALERGTFLVTNKNASRKKVVRELKHKGIDRFLIEDTLILLPVREEKNLEKKLIALINKNKDNSLFMAKSKISAKLKGEGFISEDIASALQSIRLEEYIDEDKNLVKAYEKEVNKRFKGVKASPIVVYNKLRKAGYPSAKIKEMIEGESDED